MDQADEDSWSRPPGFHRHCSLTGRGSLGWTRAAWGRWRDSNPRSGRTETVDCRYPTPAGGPGEGSPLCLFQVAEAVLGRPTREGPGRAPAACTPPFLHPSGAGRSLPWSPWRERRELHPLWLGHGQPCRAVTLRPREVWCTPLDSHQHSALIERVSCSWTRGAWSGQRVPPPRSPRWRRGVLLTRPWPHKDPLAARAGVEPAARCFKGSSPFRYRVPGRMKPGAASRYRPESFWSSARRATSTPKRLDGVARAGVEPAATCFRDRAPYRHGVPGSMAVPTGADPVPLP